MAGLDDLLSYFMGGTQMGNWLGVTSPTASTQAPLAVPSGTAPTASGPMLGGAPPAGGGGLPGGLLGGRQPVNPASYFMPRPGILGDSPLGNAVLGAFSGLGSGAGYGGLTGMGEAFTGGSQAVQDRRKQQMATVLAGQEYQKGQQGLITGNLQNQFALDKANIIRRHFGQPLLTMADLIANPGLVATTLQMAPGGQPQAGGQGGGGGTASTAAPAVTLQGTSYMVPQQGFTSPTGVPAQTSAQVVRIPPVTMDAFKQAIGGLEGTTPDKASGAIGGLTEGTFNQYANPGESFQNPQDRAAVTDRVLADLYQKSGGDTARMAVGWFSGPGNIAPPGSPTPWIKGGLPDAHGTTVAGYVGNFARSLGQGQPPGAANANVPMQGQQGATGGQVATGGGGQPTGGDARVTEAYQNAIDMAYASGDITKAGELEAKLAEYQAAPQQAAATTGATGQVEFGGQQKQYDRATKLADDYKSNKTVQLYGLAKPAADAFNAAYQERGQPGGSSDYAMVEAALQVLNPGVPVARPGTAEYATQLQTLPGQVAEQIKKAFDSNSAIPDPAAAQLKQAVDDRMAINQKLISKVNESFRSRAKTDAPQVGENYWNPEGFGSEPAQGGSQTTGGQTQSPAKPQWTQDHPATLGAGASEQAQKEWFERLPPDSWFINPKDGKLMRKVK